jgi:F0F1-type ATP synthase epsilon subunit
MRDGFASQDSSNFTPLGLAAKSFCLKLRAGTDVPRAASARKRAEERIRAASKDVDLERAMASLGKAMARLQAAKERA